MKSSLNLRCAVVDSAKSPQSCPVAAVAGNILLWQDNIVATCVFALFFEPCREHWSEVEGSAFDERMAAWRVARAAPRFRACVQTTPVPPPLKSTHPQWTPSITYRFSTRKKNSILNFQNNPLTRTTQTMIMKCESILGKIFSQKWVKVHWPPDLWLSDFTSRFESYESLTAGRFLYKRSPTWNKSWKKNHKKYFKIATYFMKWYLSLSRRYRFVTTTL